MAKPKPDSDDPILAELISIKRLLAFGLMKTGASQDDVAGALGISQSSMSRMFSPPGKKPKGAGRKPKA